MAPPPHSSGFLRFLREQIAAAALGGLSVGLLLAALLLYVGNVGGNLSFDIELGRSDVLWFLVLPPSLLIAAGVLVSPLSYALLWLIRRARRRGRD